MIDRGFFKDRDQRSTRRQDNNRLDQSYVTVGFDNGFDGSHFNVNSSSHMATSKATALSPIFNTGIAEVSEFLSFG